MNTSDGLRLCSKQGPIPHAPEDRILLALGFTFAHREVDTAIVGTHNPAHMKSNIAMVENELPIDSRVIEELYRRFDAAADEDWYQRG